MLLPVHGPPIVCGLRLFGSLFYVIFSVLSSFAVVFTRKGEMVAIL